MATRDPAERAGTDDDPLEFADGAAWEAWLDEHHDSSGGVWLRIGKKGSSLPLVSIGDALDGALCFGWIDSQRKGLDADSYRQRYSLRRAGSPWSQVNVEKVAALEAAGRMRPAGVASVAEAEADGRWDAAYERQSTATVPPDLAAALAADPVARARFDALDRTERYALFLRLMKARTPGSRAGHLDRIVAELSR